MHSLSGGCWYIVFQNIEREKGKNHGKTTKRIR